MAEAAAGLAIGAVGLVSLATTVSDCFDKIETARNLGKGIIQIELELAATKLKYRRWVDSVRIQDSTANPGQTNLPVASAEEAILAKSYLGAIQKEFERAEKSTAKYFVEDAPQNASNANVVDVDTRVELAAWFTKRAERRQKGVSLIKKVTWSLRDQRRLQALATVVSSNVASLVELFPADEYPALQERQLDVARRDVEELAPAGNIEQLKLLAATAMQLDDPWLRAAAEAAGENRQSHTFSYMELQDTAKAVYGDDFARNATDPGTRHRFHKVVARGGARALYGNRSGWDKSFMDD